MDVCGQIHAPAVVPPPPEEGTPFYMRLKGGPGISLDVLDERNLFTVPRFEWRFCSLTACSLLNIPGTLS